MIADDKVKYMIVVEIKWNLGVFVVVLPHPKIFCNVTIQKDK